MEKIKYDFSNKNTLLTKLRNYSINPDDDVIRVKNQIKKIFMYCPELLYAMHEKDLENELFDDDGNLNVDENGEPLGEWDRYFGENSVIRPFLYIPQTQEMVKNFVCYQVSFTESPDGNNREKYCLITFNIFVNGKNSIDELTGIPRHDLIASIIRERIAWSGIAGGSAVPLSNKESITDNNYLVRTLVYEAIVPNSLVKTEIRQDGTDFTYYSNKVKL